MKKFISLIWAVCMTLPVSAQVRGKVDIPNLKGYVTLKCDFHMHTVFSDGRVWPTTKVEEAYRDGLDVISITDHIGKLKDVYDNNISRNVAYDIALPAAKAAGIILIKGGEISHQMPPGHHNAIFLDDLNELYKPGADQFRAAKAQDAFIFWNHPGWERHQPDTTLWWDEHTQLLQQGMMHGIEVVNDQDYFAEAHRWCLEKNLTMFGNSDEHDPMSPFPPGKHRVMTLVFARSATPEAIREALNERRTAVYYEEFVIGEEKYLKELLENALEWKTDKIEDGVLVTVTNKSDLMFRLRKADSDPRLIYFRSSSIKPHIIPPKGEHSFTVRMRGGIKSGDVNFVVENFLVQPNEGMRYAITITNYEPTN